MRAVFDLGFLGFTKALLFLSVISPCTAESPAGSEKTALDAYVAAPDASYQYTLERKLREKAYTGYLVRMQSQTWLSEKEVDRTAWVHDLIVIVPEKVRSKVGLLFIGGGANGDPVPDSVNKELAKIAVASQTVVTELRQVPNQPLRFLDDPDKRDRIEDAAIAFGWANYLRGGGEKWLAYLPMTKSAVRAMDTITDLCRKEAEVPVEQYVVAGLSKRGWTTWTTAAVDGRVRAIVPMVIDMLNLRPSFRHHYQAYGFYASPVGDYQEAGIMDWQDTARFAQLLKVVEPYEYRSRFTLPKLLINSAGDQFFLPDSSQFYFDDLPAEKFLRYVPNADHTLRGSDAYETLLAYYGLIVGGLPRPKFSWKSLGEGNLLVDVEDEPAEVRLWRASNPEARDFREESIGKSWASTMVKPGDDGSYRVNVPPPDKGWTAFMIELTYPTPAKVPLKLTTPVEVIPRKLPFPPYVPRR